MGYTKETIAFVKELRDHVHDPKGVWHKQNQNRYEQSLRDPTNDLIEQLRECLRERSAAVASANGIVGRLKKNDFGKGGWYDYYWFAFYHPEARKKSKSAQLYFQLDGGNEKWHYGFSVWSGVNDEHLENLNAAIRANAALVAEYFSGAPTGTIIEIGGDDEEEEDEQSEDEEGEGEVRDEQEAEEEDEEEEEEEDEEGERLSSGDFASRLTASSGVADALCGTSYGISVFREYPLDALIDHADGLVEEVGKFFAWAWPLFQASRTGTWGEQSPLPLPRPSITHHASSATLRELSEATSLPYEFLDNLEEALLARQQVVLVGPPGTSKTFLAHEFAQYFVSGRSGRSAGVSHTLYMHASWSYEDFFEGIRPTATDGGLRFEPKKGFFLEWVEKLAGYDPSAHHVLVLDEINRCDTAAVLGELLQLLEYRGTEVGLLSGRLFTLPKQLYIIGTMNSADRSIGRMDLALRRRFLWLELYPQSDTLRRWLNRPNNNPIGFDVAAFETCNDMLRDRGIPSEQHIGHALFMGQEPGPIDGSTRDKPLTKEHLTRIVRFSVIPYLKELFMARLGKEEEEFCKTVEHTLLRCTGTPAPS